MQPLSHQRIEAGGLHVGMRQEDVQQRVQTAKAIVSHAIGMNNHMGSAATADAELMRKLMQELKVQDLFFLDSRTIGRSVAGKIAKEYGVQSLDRHIFWMTKTLMRMLNVSFNVQCIMHKSTVRQSRLVIHVKIRWPYYKPD